MELDEIFSPDDDPPPPIVDDAFEM